MCSVCSAMHGQWPVGFGRFCIWLKSCFDKLLALVQYFQNMEDMESGAIYCGMPRSIRETSDTQLNKYSISSQLNWPGVILAFDI